MINLSLEDRIEKAKDDNNLRQKKKDVDGVRTLNNEPQKKMAENLKHKELMNTIKLGRMKVNIKSY